MNFFYHPPVMDFEHLTYHKINQNIAETLINIPCKLLPLFLMGSKFP